MNSDILSSTTDQVRKDIEFLLTFVPATDPAKVVKGLAPMFYITGTYEGDVKLAKRAKAIIERYDVEVEDPEEEDFADEADATN